MSRISRRMGSVAPSQTTAFTALVAAERRKGREIIDLAIIQNAMPCSPPQGAFYLFPDISGHLPPGASAGAFCTDMLHRAAVALVPGEAFGAPDHIRISFAVDGDDLRRGLERMMARL